MGDVRMEVENNSDRLLREYPICIIVQLEYEDAEDVRKVLDFRNSIGEAIENRLEEERMGFCDGGDLGGETMNIFFYVNDVNQSFSVIKELLWNMDDVSKRNLKIVSIENEKMDVLYPEGGTFSVFK